jgi:hypothetical protein
MSRNLLLAIVALSFGVLLAAKPLMAHHAFAAEFDDKKPVKVTGVVKKVEWMNPHIWFYVEGKDEVTGRTAVWGFSGGAPGQLTRRGVPRTAMKIGDTVKVEGFQAKDGSANASGGRVTFADGRQVFTAAAEDVLPR